MPDVADLLNLDLAQLQDQWEKIFEARPPVTRHKGSLARLLAFELQRRTKNKNISTLLKKLDAALPSDRNQPTVSSSSSASLRHGARLMRTWNGSVHEITVLERKFAYRGKTYRSLSAIARAITGARWSGPRFFGIESSSARGAS